MPDAADSNIVILTSGVARKPGQSRLELAQTNVNITQVHHAADHQVRARRDLYHRQQPGRYPDVYSSSSTPACLRTISSVPAPSSIPRACESRLSQYYNISQNNVHAYVFGEHGDSSFIPWSLANISNVPIAEYHEND